MDTAIKPQLNKKVSNKNDLRTDFFVCPYCKGALTEDVNLSCQDCGYEYPKIHDMYYFLDNSHIKETQKDMLEYYGETSKNYNISHGSSLYGTTYNIEKYYNNLFNKYISKESNILEFGAGTGRFSRIFRNYAKVLYIADLSSKMLAQNKVKANSRVCADTQYLPFKNDLCDCAVGMTTFSYVPDKERALLEIKRIVKKDGTIIIVDQNAKSFLKSLAKLYYYSKRKKNRVSPTQESHLDYMKELFIRNNIEIIDAKCISFVPHALPKILALLLMPFDILLSLLSFTQKQAMRYYIIGKVLK